jgi:hypothetical protein
MSKGIVVDHKESGVRYAISEENIDEATEEYVRDLKPGETILGYVPKSTRIKEDTLPEGTELSLPKTPDPKDVAKTTEGQGSITPAVTSAKQSEPDKK